MAVASYADANGHFPPAYQLGPDERPWHSWRVLILPYIEGHDVYNAYTFDEPWDGPNNSRLAERMPKIYAFHGAHQTGRTTTNYLAVVGERTMWPGAAWRTRGDAKGAGDTILLVENNGLNVHWMEPRDLTFATMDFRIDSPAGVSSWYDSPAVVGTDGAVRRLSSEMTADELRAALTVADAPAAGGAKTWTEIEDGRARPRKVP